MSRIIIERHRNGEEHITTGWDHPLGTAFIDVYLSTGFCIDTHGPLNGESLLPADVRRRLEVWEVDDDTIDRVLDLLDRHLDLDYPESNVVVDMTQERVQ